jgi:hypothetical protein
VSAPWVAAFVCLWVAVIVLAFVLVGVLRRVVAALEHASSGEPKGAPLPAGPPLGQPLPGYEVETSGGDSIRLSELPVPLVLAVLTSSCSPCLAIADRLRSESERLTDPSRLVVVTDQTGHERIDLDHILTVLVDKQGLLLSVLDLPATPFVVTLSADGTVSSARIPGGAEDLFALVAGVRERRERGAVSPLPAEAAKMMPARGTSTRDSAGSPPSVDVNGFATR